MKIGIDASNINDGGGVTHLTQIINNFEIKKSKLNQIIIWGNKKTLSKINKKKYIKKVTLNNSYKNILFRIFWQIFLLKNELKKYKCDKALVLGGIFFFKNIPTTIIMQNILPFDSFALKRYSFIFKLKCLIQKILFVNSIKKTNKIIFISKASKNQILKKISTKNIKYTIIPHGVLKDKFSKRNFIIKKNIKLLCVSKIDFYKNQLVILQAIRILVDQGYQIKLKLIGSNFKPALKEIKRNILNLNLNKFVKIHNEINFKTIKKEYKNSNIHISPSFCESFGITVIESGNYSVPTICSNIDIFKEITGRNAFFFNPYSAIDLVNTIKKVINNNYERKKRVKGFYKFIIKNYSWKKVAFKTFNFVQNEK